VEAAARRDPNDSVSRSRVGTSGRELGNVLRHNDPRRALAAYDLGLLRVSQIPANSKTMRDRALLLANSSYALRSLHRSREAQARVDEALRLLRTTRDYPSERTPIDGAAFAVVSAEADLAAAEGYISRAIQTYEELEASVLAARPAPVEDLRDALGLSRLYGRLSALCRLAGDGSKAELMKSQYLELWRHWDARLPQNAFVRGSSWQ
jgi:tetratricopeptide (TPR) repeat protein